VIAESKNHCFSPPMFTPTSHCSMAAFLVNCNASLAPQRPALCPACSTCGSSGFFYIVHIMFTFEHELLSCASLINAAQAWRLSSWLCAGPVSRAAAAAQLDQCGAAGTRLVHAAQQVTLASVYNLQYRLIVVNICYSSIIYSL
jgi:hypothetical protein